MVNTSILYFFRLLVILLPFAHDPDYQDTKRAYSCDVQFTKQQAVIDAVWDNKFWKGSEPQRLNNYMGSKPSHFPETQVKLKYDNNNIYVIFRVKDHYVRAVAKETNGKVYEDSCVELFFTPGSDVNRGYFNLETNCKGVFLFQYHLNNGKKQGFVDSKDAGEIEMSHSLEKNAENEITEPLVWTIEYKIPFSILSKYMDVDKPASGVRWKANFYKCGDKTSHPHWLTWAPVVFPKPNFHLPEFFGWLEFK
jgi:hypothetical protein